MTSQNSTNKQPRISLWKLMREDLRHKRWMLALSILGNFLAGPVSMLFSYSSAARRAMFVQIKDDLVYDLEGTPLMTTAEWYRQLAHDCFQYINEIHLVLLLGIAFLGAMIVGFAAFRYLYSKRMVDLYHSAPVSRRMRFAAVWLNGFLIWFVPCLVCNVIVYVGTAIFINGTLLGTLTVTLLIMLLRLTLCYLITYNACLVAVMLSGNALNALVNGLTYGLLAYGLVSFYLGLMGVFFPSFYLPERLILRNPLFVLSPFTTPIILANAWIDSMPFSVWSWQCIGGVLVMLANLALAFFLYLKRPSELAERGLECKPVRVLFRTSISVLSGLGFALVFYMATSTASRGWVLFGLVFGSALAFCVLNVIYHGTFKEVFSHKIQYGVVLAISALVFFGIRYDVAGYETRLPKQEDVTGLSFFCGTLTNSDFNFVLTDQGIKRTSYLTEPDESLIFRDQKSIYELLKALQNKECKRDSYSYSIFLKVYTKTGSYYRSYRITRDDLELLAPFVETEEYVRRYYAGKSLAFGMPSSMCIRGDYDSIPNVSSERMQQLMEAMHQDFEDHRTISDLVRTHQVFSLDVVYDAIGEDGAYSYSFNYVIPYWYERTIALVSAWYPNMLWNRPSESFTSVHISESIGMAEGESLRDAIYRYYGFHPDGTPIALMEENYANMRKSSELPYDVRVSYEIHSPEIVQALEPNLIWGRYTAPLGGDYVHLGNAQSENYRVNCYVAYGKMPLTVLDDIVAATEKRASEALREKYEKYPETYDYPY